MKKYKQIQDKKSVSVDLKTYALLKTQATAECRGVAGQIRWIANFYEQYATTRQAKEEGVTD
tara:strand:+ start:626 stop:811 length:186 start_codon:yes stop_codon:yes gene_type:complete